MEIEKFRKTTTQFINIKRKSYRLLAGFSMSTAHRGRADVHRGGDRGRAVSCRSGGITAGDYVAYLLFVSTLLVSIRRIVEFTEQFQNGMTSIERFCTLMDEIPDVEDIAGRERGAQGREGRGDV